MPQYTTKHNTLQKAYEYIKKEMKKVQDLTDKWCPTTAGYVILTQGEYLVYLYTQQPCHAMIGSWGSHMVKGCVSIFNAIQGPTSDEAKTFWHYIYDPIQSPWRSVLEHSSLMYDAKQNPICVRIDEPLDLSLQTMVNLFIASRIPLEHPHSLDLFTLLLNEGFSKLEALYTLSHFSLGKDKLRTSPGGHFPFDNSETSWEALKQCKPKLVDKKRFKDGNGYRPCNAIWQAQSNPKDVLFRKAEAYTGAFKKSASQYNPDVVLNFYGVPEFILGMPTVPDFVTQLKGEKRDLFFKD